MKRIIYLLLLLLSNDISNAQSMTDSAINANLKEAFQLLKTDGKSVMDPDRAYKLIKQCADVSSAKAFFALGWLYAKGLGVAADGQQAIYWYEKAATNGSVTAFTRIGHLYKHSSNPDFEKAYTYYCKAADKNDMEGLFYKAYMLYKGFGCQQNYSAAYPLFQRSAAMRNPHAMRFIGLSMRNGYGTKVNTDSAMYWLRMASRYGNGMSNDELAAAEPENADIAGSLVDKVKAAELLIPKSKPVNKYSMVQHSAPANKIEGNYKGWLLKYDWSGEHVVKADQLKIELVYDNDQLKGRWIENDTVSISLTAMPTRNALIFKDMEYSKHDHYYRDRAELLRFEKAGLQMITENDTTYLCGDIKMYSVNRNEPTKPMYVALVKTSAGQQGNNKDIPLVNEDGTPLILKSLNTYPNPFTTIFTLDFELKQACVVETRLQTLDGKLVYKNAGGKLEAGNYTLPIQPKNLTAGTYILTLQYGSKVATVRVIKL